MYSYVLPFKKNLHLIIQTPEIEKGWLFAGQNNSHETSSKQENPLLH